MKKGLLVLSASVLIQLCIGGVYAWSGFAAALGEAHALGAARAQLVFGVLIAVFTLSMVCAGRLLERHGPRVVAGIGGVLFGAGYLVGSFSGGSFPLLFAGIGLLAGVGTGFCYVCPLAVCVSWFPSRRGLVAGLVAAGFGAGAALLSFLALFLFSRGLGVLAVFRLVGLSFGAVILASAMALEFPPPGDAAGRKGLPPAPGAALIGDRFFLGLVLGMFCGTFAGLLVIGNLAPLALAAGSTPALAGAAVSIFALGNAAGRVAWGWAADRLGGRAVPASLAFLAVAVALLGLASARPAGLLAGALLVGFGFGACFVVYALQVCARYGPEAIGGVYPFVFLAYGFSGLAGPWAGGLIFDLTGGYAPAVLLAFAVAAAGLFAGPRLLVLSRGAAGSAGARSGG